MPVIQRKEASGRVLTYWRREPTQPTVCDHRARLLFRVPSLYRNPLIKPSSSSAVMPRTPAVTTTTHTCTYATASPHTCVRPACGARLRQLSAVCMRACLLGCPRQCFVHMNHVAPAPVPLLRLGLGAGVRAAQKTRLKPTFLPLTFILIFCALSHSVSLSVGFCCFIVVFSSASAWRTRKRKPNNRAATGTCCSSVVAVALVQLSHNEEWRSLLSTVRTALMIFILLSFLHARLTN